MSETVTVALVTGVLVVASGAVGALAQVFGPAWHESRRRKTETRAAAEVAQREKAVDFLQELWSGHIEHYRRSAQARVAFLGALPSERLTPGILKYTANILQNTSRQDERTFADNIFGWLGGTVSDDELLSLADPLTPGRRGV